MSGHLTLHPTQLRQWWYNVVTTLVCAAPQPDCFTWRLQTRRHVWAQHDSEMLLAYCVRLATRQLLLLFQPGAKLAAASSLIQSWLASHRLRAEQPRREPARGRLQLNSGRCSTVINHHARDVTHQTARSTRGKPIWCTSAETVHCSRFVLAVFSLFLQN